MPFQIVRNDISNMTADAIVNTANPRPEVGSGVDSAIHAAAGPELLEVRKKIGRILPGHAAITPGYRLHARYVIHAVGPVWRGGFLGEERQLRRCYDRALALALEHGCESIAFPLISTGNYGFPKDKALTTAISAFRDFLAKHEMEITLVVFDRESLQLSKGMSARIACYIDEHYVNQKLREEYGSAESAALPRREDFFEEHSCEPFLADPGDCFLETEQSMGRESAEYPKVPRPGFSIPRPKQALSAGKPAAAAVPSLDQLLKQLDAGFSETLLTLIDKTGRKDSEIYTRANISRQHFSKIRNTPGYKPTKATAIAFAIALELDLDQTRDLIGRAGYALTNSSISDVIIMYFIGQGIYDMYTINLALFEHDQSILG